MPNKIECIDSGAYDKSMKKILFFSTLLLSLLTGCSSMGESQAYKDGWNTGWETLNYPPMSSSEFNALCESSVDVYAGNYGYSTSSSEAQDFLKGCKDWGVSGEKGLNQK